MSFGLKLQLKRRLFVAFALFGVVSVLPLHNASAQLTPYSQDFELPGIDQTDLATLGDDGWLVGANVFKRDTSTYLDADTTVLRYNYFSFPAPNNPGAAAFSLVKTTTFEGTPPQGDQEIVVISDYQNTDHGDPNDRIEGLFFREQTVGASDVGKTATFSFLAHADTVSDISSGTTKANAFIKSLDPTFFFTKAKYSVETTALDSDPNNFVQMTLRLPITNDLSGDVLQFGFDTWASGFEPSAVAYDVVEFSIEDTFGSYFSDFEAETGTVAANPEALNNGGWRVFGAVFDSGENFKFQYGPFGAPNGGNGFSSVASGEAGPSQGTQYLNTFSDYDCCSGTGEGHFNGTDLVDSSIYQEFLVGADDPNRQVSFSFDAKLPTTGGLGGSSSATFYIRTLDPNAGFSVTAESLIDAATLGLNTSTWVDGEVLFDIVPSMVGQLIQFGVTNRSSNFGATGILLDNISFTDSAGGIAGDFNGDGRVDADDFLEWQRNPAIGNLADWEANYGQPITSNVNAVPEPSSLLLCVVTASLLSGVRRRR